MTNNAFTIWLTGLSASGKTTLANEIEHYLKQRGMPVQIIDGDIVRKEIGGLFGYSREERIRLLKVYTLIANLLNNNKISVVVAAVSAYEEMREFNRRNIKNYIEIYLNCPLDMCMKRDVKGLYERCMRGEEQHVIGIDEPYETPDACDMELDTANSTIEECMHDIKLFLESV